MKCLDLFSGTGSFKKACIAKGWECVTLDIDGRSDITTDILEWDYKSYDGEFDIIGAFPPCNDYSCMNYCRPEKVLDLTHANSVVQRTLDIIDHFKPKWWILENPQTSLLKRQSFMHGLPYVDVDYCKYGYGCRKRTRLWTNIKGFEGLQCKKDCGLIVDNKHPSFRYLLSPNKGQSRLDYRHTIPPKLFNDLLLKILP